MEPVQHHRQRRCLCRAGHWQVSEEPHRYGHQLPIGIREHQRQRWRLWQHRGPACRACYHGRGSLARHDATDASDGQCHGGGGVLERWRHDGVMLHLISGEGQMRPLGVLSSHGACFLRFSCCVEPVLEEAPTTVISLATGPASALAPNSKCIETNRFIYIDTSVATLKQKKKCCCGPLTNKLKRMRQWWLETRR
jgi:hypothetical protein